MSPFYWSKICRSKTCNGTANTFATKPPARLFEKYCAQLQRFGMSTFVHDSPAKQVAQSRDRDLRLSDDISPINLVPPGPGLEDSFRRFVEFSGNRVTKVTKLTATGLSQRIFLARVCLIGMCRFGTFA